MKFKATLLISLGLHLSLAALFIIQPAPKSAGMTYYVDLINLGGGGNGGGNGGGGNGSGGGDGRGNGPGGSPLAPGPEASPEASLIEAKSNSVKNLTVEKSFQSSLRYPDREGRNKVESEKMISVIRKDRPAIKSEVAVRGTPVQNGLKTGISSGGGGGYGGSGGGGGGGGGGYGTGIGDGYFPYAYYVDLLRSRISSSWYSSLVAPGLKGKYVAGVYFIVRRDGEISDLRLENASGIASLDMSARRAIENAAPFAPLPPDFPSQYLVVHFEFEWEK
jgi:TonB family protein